MRAIDIYRRQRSRFLTTTVVQPKQPELPMSSIDVMRISFQLTQISSQATIAAFQISGYFETLNKTPN